MGTQKKINLIFCKKHFPSYSAGEKINQSISFPVCEELWSKTHSLTIPTHYKPQKAKQNKKPVQLFNTL